MKNRLFETSNPFPTGIFFRDNEQGSMASWRLQTTGKMDLVRIQEQGEETLEEFQEGENSTAKKDCSVVGFKNRLTWVLLASLTTDPRTCQREALACRICDASFNTNSKAALNSGTSQLLTKLRGLVSDLVNGKGGKVNKSYVGIGKESLFCSPSTIQLKPDTVVTDIEEAEALYVQARATTDRQLRMELLREAGRLLEGEFLPGFKLPRAALTWYDNQVLIIEGLRYEIWQMYFHATEENEEANDLHLIAEAWNCFQYINMPADIDTPIKKPAALSRLSRVLKFRRSVGSAQRVRRVPGIKWKDFLPQLVRQKQSGFALTVQEEKRLLDTLSAALALFPEEVATTFRRLSVFPQPFTRHQAAAICGSSVNKTVDESFNRLTEATLLQKVTTADTRSATTIGEETEERYSLPPFIAPLIWQKLSSSQKTRLKKRHAQHFARFDGSGWPNEPMQSRRERLARWCQEEQANYMQALDVCLESPLTEETITFISRANQSAAHVASRESALLSHEILRRAVPRLREAVESGQAFTYNPAFLLFRAALGDSNFAEATDWANVVLGYLHFSTTCSTSVSDVSEVQGADRRDLTHTVELLLAAIHHTGRFQEFDELLQIAGNILSEITDDQVDAKVTRLGFRRSMQFIKAENRWSRGDYKVAFKANQAALTDLDTLVTLVPVLTMYYPATYYQRGCIQWDMGHMEAAVTDWDKALGLFQQQDEPHGVADCKKRIGKALGEKGQFTMALNLIREAIAIYAAQDKEPGRIAALGTLADVLVMQGQTQEARRYYEEGLDYWRTVNHSGWIELFVTSLNKLPQAEQNKEA